MVNFPDRTLTAGAGQGASWDFELEEGSDGSGGVAAGGDINVNGESGGSAGASYGPFIGGGVRAGSAPAGVPGGNGDGANHFGAPGRLIVTRVSA